MQLKEKVNPTHTALLVIDVQNDFCADNGAFQKAGFNVHPLQEMVPDLSRFIDESRKAQVPIIFVRCIYATKEKQYLSEVFLEQAKRRGTGLHTDIPLCEENSWGSDFYQVKPLEGETIVTKHRFDAFIDTDLDLILRSQKIKTIITTGVVTECCVESTARHGFFKDYFVVVPKDCVASTVKRYHEVSLEYLGTTYGEVTTSDDIIRSWHKQ